MASGHATRGGAVLVLVALGIQLPAGVLSSEPLPPSVGQQAVCLASGSSDGNYFRIANALAASAASDASLTIQPRVTQGSYENADLLRSGACDAALIQSDVAYLEIFEGRPFEAIASLYTESIHVLARSELAMTRTSELPRTSQPLRIAIGTPGSGSASHALTMLDALGLASRRDNTLLGMDISEALQGLHDRRVDIAFVTSAIPAPALLRRAPEAFFTLLTVDGDTLSTLARGNPFFSLVAIPYEAYGVTGSDVETLGTRTLLVVRTGSPDSLVVALLEALYRSSGEAAGNDLPFLQDLTPEAGLSEIPISIHPASRDYHAVAQSDLRIIVGQLRRYVVPLLLLVAFLTVLYRFAPIVFFIHQFRLGRLLVLLAFVWVSGAGLMFVIEGGRNSNFATFPDSAIAILHYLFSGLEAKYPITLLGNVVAIVILVLGLTLATMFTATLVTILMEKALHVRRLRLRPYSWLPLKGHVVITGWSRRTERLLQQLRSPDLGRWPTVVVVTEDASKTAIDTPGRVRDLWVVQGDFTKSASLLQADIGRARSAVVLAEDTAATDADRKSVVATLMIESMAPQVHTICEAIRPDMVEHLEHCRANEIVDTSSLVSKLICQSVLSPGVMDVFLDVLTFGLNSDEIYVAHVPPRLDAKTFAEAQRMLLEEELVLLGYFAGSARRRVVLNPRKSEAPTVGSAGYMLRSPQRGTRSDRLIFLSDRGSQLAGPGRVRRLLAATRGSRRRTHAPAKDTTSGVQLRPTPGEYTELRVCICGWNRSAPELIRGLRDRALASGRHMVITIVSEMDAAQRTPAVEGDESWLQNVDFVLGDPTRKQTLRELGLEQYACLVLLSEDDSEARRRFSDHRAVVIALAARELSAELHIVAEVLLSQNREFFDRVPGVDIVSVDDLTEKILAQAVISPGITRVFTHLLTPRDDSNEVALVRVPDEWVGRTWAEVNRAVVASDEPAILLGYQTPGNEEGVRSVVLNPRRKPQYSGGVVSHKDHRLRETDSLVVLWQENLPSAGPG